MLVQQPGGQLSRVLHGVVKWCVIPAIDDIDVVPVRDEKFDDVIASAGGEMERR